jgi:hypothetical protein
MLFAFALARNTLTLSYSVMDPAGHVHGRCGYSPPTEEGILLIRFQLQRRRRLGHQAAEEVSVGGEGGGGAGDEAGGQGH